MKGKLTKLGVFLLLLLGLIGIVDAALYNTVSITANMIIPNNCIFSANTANIVFGSMAQGTSIATNVNVIVTNGGNIGSNIFVAGTAWGAISAFSGNTFVVGNTVWSATPGTSWASATKLTGSAADTSVTVALGGTGNYIYFGAAAPLYQPANTYVQTISVTNSC